MTSRTRPLLNRRLDGLGNLLVVTDEAYEHLTFDREHIPLATIDGMRERTVSIGSAGKTFSFTGWKVGWATGTPELIGAVRTTKQFLTYVSSGPFQYAIAQALDLPDGYFTEMAADLKARRDLLAGGLKEIGFEVYAPDGTYFITTDIAPLGEKDAMDFCLALPDRTGRWSGSPSASAPRCSPRRSAGSPHWRAEGSKPNRS